MGIVVTIVMFLGIIFLLKPYANKYTSAVAVLLIVFGGWNALWHGVRHWQEFWGVAALVSGTFMLFAALLLLARSKPALLCHYAVFSDNTVTWFRRGIVLGLMLHFLLYFITLVQLNLGYPIIR